MTDDLREKVIKGLEHCKCRSGCNSNCPYSPIMEDHNFGIDECTSQLADDALTLLKAREPRVMTLEEVRGIRDFIPCWIEYLDDDKCIFEPAFVKFDIGFYHLLHDTITPQMHERTYGAKWRIWTARPTDEQRKAVKWE